MNLIREIKLNETKICHSLDLDTMRLWNYKQWEGELSKTNIKAFGIFIEQRLRGVCVSHLLFTEAELRYFSIHPEFQRRGLGTKLINRLLNHCAENEIEKIFLEVSSKNETALSFYQSIGFYTVNIRKNYYQDGSDALLKEIKILKK